MPECRNCHQYYFGDPDACPKCYFNFKTGMIEKPAAVTRQEKWKAEQQVQKEKEAYERAKEVNDKRTLAMLKSPRYEYTTVMLQDNWRGMVNKAELDAVLTSHAEAGWKLHSVICNEAGKNSSSVSVGGTSFGTNATMEVTILIFERCIKLAEV